jgi:hypothetical protein
MPKTTDSATLAHKRYKNSQGQIVPGVTTIISLLNKPALIHWAWNLGMEGTDYRKVTDKAANIGTITHYLVECYLKGTEPSLDNFTTISIHAAQIAFSNFKQWWEQQQLKVVASECSLVSEVMQCGGTLDCVAAKYFNLADLRPGELWLVDIKTSKDIYDEMRYQLAAYWAIWNENYPDQPLTNAHIIQLSKEDGRLVHHSFDRLFTELEIFRHLRIVYGLRKDKDPKRNLDRVFKKLTLDRL